MIIRRISLRFPLPSPLDFRPVSPQFPPPSAVGGQAAANVQHVAIVLDWRRTRSTVTAPCFTGLVLAGSCWRCRRRSASVFPGLNVMVALRALSFWCVCVACLLLLLLLWFVADCFGFGDFFVDFFFCCFFLFGTIFLLFCLLVLSCSV